MSEKRLKTKINLEIQINDDKQLLCKLNEIANKYDLSLDYIIEMAIEKLFYDIEFIQSLRAKINYS